MLTLQQLEEKRKSLADNKASHEENLRATIMASDNIQKELLRHAGAIGVLDQLIKMVKEAEATAVSPPPS